MVTARISKVCRLLNKNKARYVVIGGEACVLYGLTRTTEDIDIFIDKSLENIEKVLKALAELPYGIAKEISAEEIAEKPFTIIGDQPRVDILTALSGIPFDSAWKSKKTARVEGVNIHYLALDLLIKSKDTDRLQDLADKEALERLKRND